MPSKTPAPYSASEVLELAQKVGVSIQRLAPSWGWFMTTLDKSKKKFASDNLEAFKKLTQMMSEKMLASKHELRVWHCTTEAGLSIRNGAKQFDLLAPMAVCAPSRNAAIKLLNEKFNCGAGTSRPSFGYKVRKFWVEGWPSGMYQEKLMQGVYEIKTTK